MYGIGVGTHKEQICHRMPKIVGLPVGPKLGKWLQHKAALVHPGVGQFQFCVRESHKGIRQYEVDVDAAAGIAWASGGADPAQPPLHFKAFPKQSLGFTIPFNFYNLVDKVWPLKAPGGGAPKASGAGDGPARHGALSGVRHRRRAVIQRAPCKRRARLRQNL